MSPKKRRIVKASMFLFVAAVVVVTGMVGGWSKGVFVPASPYLAAMLSCCITGYLWISMDAE